MKSHKRSPLERALTRGYIAGSTGKSRSQCPHENGEVRQNWMTGWREGRQDHWNGYNTLAQLQKVNNL